MRRIVTAISAAALAFGLVAQAMPAAAVAGYDSAYAGESDFLTLSGGQSGSFTVFFSNAGTTSWVKGTATQVDLAACLEDKVTCNSQDASEAPFTSGWLSATRYATHTQTTVGPGQIGTFTYSVAVPAAQAAGTYRFNGAAVLSATGADIHNEGYYQDVTVPAAPAVSCTPTKITTSPTSANRQVGTTHTQTATADCEPPTGSTVRPLASGAQVTFIVDAAATDTGNADLTLTATTDASGVATVTWSRANPGTDAVATYPTSFPAVRASASIRWAVAAAPILVTPDTAATVKNDGCRAFTVTTQSLTTGAAASRKVLLNFTENVASTTFDDKGAFFKIPANGANVGSPTNTAYSSLTTDSAGSGTFDVCGAGTDVAVTPVAYYDERGVLVTDPADGLRQAGEDINDTGGKTTFEGSKATITLTPDTTATNAAGGGRIYTVTAVDQFGAAFIGTLDIGFTELTDDSTTTTSLARIAWTKVSATVPTTSGTCTGATGAAPTGYTNPSGTTASDKDKTEVTFTAGTGSTAFFGICSVTTDDTATPVVWQDISSNDGVRQTTEPQDTGGTTTWKAPALSTAGLTPASATNTASTDATAGTSTSNVAGAGSTGEEQYTAKLVDQSGNQINPTATTAVVFTVKNTGTGAVYITECRNSAGAGGQPATPVSPAAANTAGSGGIAAGGSATCSVTITSATTETAIVELDSNVAGSATIDCTISVGTSTFVCTQATKTWVDSGTAEPASGTVTGTVVAFDKANASYTLSTTIPSNFTITYGGGTDLYTVDGTTATRAQFETNLTLGDSITWTDDGTTEKHALTNK